LGHSERRHYFGEDDAWIQRKVQRALISGLQPILCIGEQLKERESGQWQKVLEGQLAGCLREATKEQMTHLAIAYEPVWAIGTGRVATPEVAQETHHFIRAWLKKQFGEEVAAKVDLLYGGSVKPDNTAALLEQEEIDGLLVGGASLDVESFAKIVNY
jgi:triosephosphate isomerase